jgi:NAD-dependent SIR2 family protein deacetylase
MGDDKDYCQNPDQLKGKPGECSPEQVEKCHGSARKHPCTEPAEKKEQKEEKN